MRLSSLLLIGTLLSSVCASTIQYNPHLIIEKRAVKPKEISEKLEKFLVKLHEFVSASGFDAPSFHLQSKYIHKKYTKYAGLVSKLKTPVADITKQLAFAQDRLRVLNAASYHISNPHPSPRPSDDLAQKVMNLDACLYYLQDSYGNPNPTVFLYQETVANFRKMIRMFQIESTTFRNLHPDAQNELLQMIEGVDRTVAGMEEAIRI